MSKKKIGLVPKLIIGIIAGILIGSFAPEFLVKVLVTASSLFSAFLKFVIPFIIIGFVTAGIADLATGAGKLLGGKSIYLANIKKSPPGNPEGDFCL